MTDMTTISAPLKKSLSSTFIVAFCNNKSAEKGLEILLRQGCGGQEGGKAVFAVLAARYSCELQRSRRFGLNSSTLFIAGAAAAAEADVECFCGEAFRQGGQIGDDYFFAVGEKVKDLPAEDAFEVGVVPQICIEP